MPIKKLNKLEYVESKHKYLYNGKIIPSVTQIVKWKYPDMYKGVPLEVLQNKARYGTEAHKCVEDFAQGKLQIDEIVDTEIKRAVTDFDILMKQHCFFPKKMEQKVCYRGRYSGTYDLLTMDDILIDIKTTSKIHLDNETKDAPLNLQMSLYKMAMKDKVNECWYVWLPKKGTSKAGKVETWSDDEIIKLLDEYEAEHCPLY